MDPSLTLNFQKEKKNAKKNSIKKKTNYCNFNLRNTINTNLCTRIQLKLTTDPL